jgi:hypothetical protein
MDPFIPCVVCVNRITQTEYKETVNGLEEMWATTVNTTYLLTGLLIPALTAARGQVVNCAAAGGTTVKLDLERAEEKEEKGDWPDAGQFRFAHAKRCQLMLTEHWGVLLQNMYVSADHKTPEVFPLRVHAMHPGTFCCIICV